MVVTQVAIAGMVILYKMTIATGMNLRILIAYRMAVAAISMAPLPFIFGRKSRPKITWVVIFQAFLCGLFGGTLFQNLYFQSIILKSATFAAALMNLNPAFTYIFAITFRMEKLGLKRVSGKAKLLGTLFGIAGAMVFAFYKGANIHVPSIHIDLLDHNHQHSHVARLHTNSKSQALGILSCFGVCLSFASWLIVQGKMSKRLPCVYTVIALQNAMAAIQSIVLALCLERNWSNWCLKWDIGLLTIVYSGTVNSGLVLTLMAWCGDLKGPLFVAIFFPLSFLLVANANDSIIGAVLIVIGLYMILWGKKKETKENKVHLQSQAHESDSVIEIVTEDQLSSTITTNGDSNKAQTSC
ncbi:WAT1-related protein At1g25270-like [Tripterygium wilfordii]|uniref:WAT1-related protein At1g25270-like n=1 Tax=Tripterygium wilfordii TaxID=458696 RepID=UPI0018F7F633|nr:WAT1-related protein At1g25270-like [Tripterygium wilfordii]